MPGAADVGLCNEALLLGTWTDLSRAIPADYFRGK